MPEGLRVGRFLFLTLLYLVRHAEVEPDPLTAPEDRQLLDSVGTTVRKLFDGIDLGDVDSVHSRPERKAADTAIISGLFGIKTI